jgi:Lamin Tail Domain
MLISGFSEMRHVKTSYRIIIDHINHNPHGKDTSDKLNEEFVVLENEGAEKVSLAGWSLTDETTTGERRHVYRFPQTVSLSPREKAVVHTGLGKDLFEPGNPPTWNLHWGRRSFVWNNEGDTATLFDAEGNRVDSLQVVTLKAT